MLIDDELQELFDGEIDGTLTGEQQRRLGQLLGDPARREGYLALVDTARQGRSLAGAVPAEGFADRVMGRLEPRTRTALRPGPLRPLVLRPVWAVAAALVLLALGALLRSAIPVPVPAPSPVLVRFVWRGQARAVSVSGSFNGWSKDGNRLKPVAPGLWETVVPVRPGTHEYGFFVDGVFTADPLAGPAVGDDFGSENSRLEI